jgi:hypothetical protein
MLPPRFIHLISGGKYHDFDYARLVLLQLMAEDEAIRVTSASDFHGLGQLARSDGLVIYTCDLMPTDAQADEILSFVREGGRLFALHASNAPIEFTDGSVVEAGGMRIPGFIQPAVPETAPAYIDLLGSRFQAHLAMQPFTVNVVDADHELTRGLDDFTVIDEPYVTNMTVDACVLLSARYKGDAPGYVLGRWEDDRPRPQMYLRQYGRGEVLYLTLGHACGRFDARPLVEETEPVKGPWDVPEFRELLRRGTRWTAGSGRREHV